MPDTAPIVAETVLEVVSPDGARRYIRVTQSPFLIGRGAEAGNHLHLSADKRISRNCAPIVVEANKRSIGDPAGPVRDAARGGLLEAGDKGPLHVGLARRSGGLRLPPESLAPSQTAIQLAVRKQSAVITEDLAQAEMDLQAAQSIVAQRLRAVVGIPVYAFSHAKAEESMVNMKRGQFLGVLYLDSRRPAAFSKLDPQ